MLANSDIVWAIHKMMDEIGPVKPSLDSRTDFQYLISVILSAQATDVSVNKVTPKLFQKYPDASNMADADILEIEDIIKSVGLFHNKAKNIKKCSQELIENFDGTVPQDREKLMQLSGVGRKTANVVISDRFNIPAFAVDTHVSAISKRLHFVKKDANPLEIETKITSVLPKSEWTKAHHTMIEFGRKYSMKLTVEKEICSLIIECDKLNNKKKQ
ncbi:endonuclease III [Companilactobacillus sp. RD055328]|uniref:endonuclease III n=1 Tax=Companilactobacillus sp. RD055328 TaxID=2916634 RepID=UPI001FC81FA0|nr:endonuclease III [Companilactobacillus sp. RD055328]GKQ42685.1 endonuclease III [Companilactobacillus sp. RD055328]